MDNSHIHIPSSNISSVQYSGVSFGTSPLTMQNFNSICSINDTPSSDSESTSEVSSQLDLTLDRCPSLSRLQSSTFNQFDSVEPFCDASSLSNPMSIEQRHREQQNHNHKASIRPEDFTPINKINYHERGVNDAAVVGRFTEPFRMPSGIVEVQSDRSRTSREVIDLGVFRSSRSVKTPRRQSTEMLQLDRSSNRYISEDAEKMSQVSVDERRCFPPRVPPLSQFPRHTETPKLVSQRSTPEPSTSGYPNTTVRPQTRAVGIKDQTSGRLVYERSTSGSVQYDSTNPQFRERSESFTSSISRPVKVASRFDHQWDTPIVIAMSQATSRSMSQVDRVVNPRPRSQTSADNYGTDHEKVFYSAGSEAQSSGQGMIQGMENIVNRQSPPLSPNKSYQWKERPQHTRTTQHTVTTSIEDQKIESQSSTYPPWREDGNNLSEPLLLTNATNHSNGTASQTITIGILCCIGWIVCSVVQQLLSYQYLDQDSDGTFKSPNDVPFLFVQTTQIVGALLGVVVISIIVMSNSSPDIILSVPHSVMSQTPPLSHRSSTAINALSPSSIRRLQSPSSIESRLEFDSAAVAVGVPTSFNPSAYSIGHPISNHKIESSIIARTDNRLEGWVGKKLANISQIMEPELNKTLICVMLLGLSRFCWARAGAISTSVDDVNVAIVLYFMILVLVWLVSVSLGLPGSHWSYLEGFLSIICLGSTMGILTSSIIATEPLGSTGSSEASPLGYPSIHGWPLGPFGSSYLQLQAPIINDDLLMSITLWLIGCGFSYGIFLGQYFLIVFRSVFHFS